jgi:hypothetical protein
VGSVLCRASVVARSMKSLTLLALRHNPIQSQKHHNMSKDLAISS